MADKPVGFMEGLFIFFHLFKVRIHHIVIVPGSACTLGSCGTGSSSSAINTRTCCTISARAAIALPSPQQAGSTILPVKRPFSTYTDLMAPGFTLLCAFGWLAELLHLSKAGISFNFS